MKTKTCCLNCAFFCARICKNGKKEVVRDDVVQMRDENNICINTTLTDENNELYSIPYCYAKQWDEKFLKEAIDKKDNPKELIKKLQQAGKDCLFYEEHSNTVVWKDFQGRLERFKLNKDIEAANITEKGVKISKIALCVSIGLGVLSLCMAWILHGCDSKQLDENAEQIVYAISSMSDKLNKPQQQIIEITKDNISITTSSYSKD